MVGKENTQGSVGPATSNLPRPAPGGLPSTPLSASFFCQSSFLPLFSSKSMGYLLRPRPLAHLSFPAVLRQSFAMLSPRASLPPLPHTKTPSPSTWLSRKEHWVRSPTDLPSNLSPTSSLAVEPWAENAAPEPLGFLFHESCPRLSTQQGTWPRGSRKGLECCVALSRSLGCGELGPASFHPQVRAGVG